MFLSYFEKENELDNSCVFCKILKGRKEENTKIYENEHIFVILDKFPLTKGHTLVILKAHKKDITLLSDSEDKALWETVMLISRALKKAFAPEKIYLASVGERVEHVHFHLIPRYKRSGKGFKIFTKNRRELKNPSDLVKLIKQNLA